MIKFVSSKCELALILCLVLKIHIGNSKKIYAYFEGVNCYADNPEVIEEIKCWLQPDSKGFLTMNAELVLKRDVMQIFNRYRFLVDVRNKNESYLSIDIDMCDAMGARHTNILKRLIAEEVHRVSNLPLGCPLKKGVRYVVSNFTIMSKYIPPFTPHLKWISNSNYYVNNEQKKTLTFDCNGRVDNDFKKIRTTNKSG